MPEKRVMSINSTKPADRSRYDVPEGTPYKNFAVLFSVGGTEYTVYRAEHERFFDTLDEAKAHARGTLQRYAEMGHAFNKATVIEADKLRGNATVDEKYVHAKFTMRDYGKLEISEENAPQWPGAREDAAPEREW